MVENSGEEGFDFSQLSFADEPKLADPAPKPSKSVPRKATAKPVKNTGGRPSKAGKIADMQEEIEGFLMLIGVPLKMRDVHPDGSSCGDMFVNLDDNGLHLSAEAIRWANAFATVGVDNSYIQKFFQMGDGASKWLGLAFATQPFIIGFASAHVGQRSRRNAANATES